MEICLLFAPFQRNDNGSVNITWFSHIRMKINFNFDVVMKAEKDEKIKIIHNSSLWGFALSLLQLNEPNWHFNSFQSITRVVCKMKPATSTKIFILTIFYERRIEFQWINNSIAVYGVFKCWLEYHFYNYPGNSSAMNIQPLSTLTSLTMSALKGKKFTRKTIMKIACRKTGVGGGFSFLLFFEVAFRCSVLRSSAKKRQFEKNQWKP